MKDMSFDASVNSLLDQADQQGFQTVWHRFQKKTADCGLGESGLCCWGCNMGPCRLVMSNNGHSRGLCGAGPDSVVTRNLGHIIASGAAALALHAKTVGSALLAAVQEPSSGFRITEPEKLRSTAALLGIDITHRDEKEITTALALAVLGYFGSQVGQLPLLSLAPQARQSLWKHHHLLPRGIDTEIVEMLNRTVMGVDQTISGIIHQATRVALAAGWGSALLASQVQDILLGIPAPVRSRVNTGVLSPTAVNIVVNGHIPLIAGLLMAASRDPELIQLAKDNHADAINVCGIGDAGTELMMRHGLPIAGDALQQELVITTGAVEVMVLDMQGIMPALADIASSFHTRLITTSNQARIPGVPHVELNNQNSLSLAKDIVREAILNFPKRRQVNIPPHTVEFVAGFSPEAIIYMLGGKFRGSLIPLNDNIINGRIKGIAIIFGSGNPRVAHNQVHVDVVRELIANDILVLQVGDAALASARAGLLLPEAAAQYAGKGLAEVCEAVGIPPVLHCGSTVDTGKILVALSVMVQSGGLGRDISELPVAAAAPEWMFDAEVAIGHCFAASGVLTIFGVGLPVNGSPALKEYLFNEIEPILGGKWAQEKDAREIARLMINHIDAKRKKLGIEKGKERVLYDMDMRRELEV